MQVAPIREFLRQSGHPGFRPVYQEPTCLSDISGPSMIPSGPSTSFTLDLVNPAFARTFPSSRRPEERLNG